MKRLLVLGAGGALGSAAARQALDAGWQVDACLRPENTSARATLLEGAGIHHCDLRDADALARLLDATTPDHVLMAAMAGRHPRSLADRQAQLSDVLGMQLALATALADRHFPGTWVNLGSYAVYDGSARQASVDALPQPRVFRGVVKAAESLLAHQLAAEHDLDLIELRVFCGWGRWMAHDRVLTRLLRAALGGPPVPLSDSPMPRDWIHHDDVARACLLATALPRKAPRCYNLCSGTSLDVREVATRLESLCGKKLVADAAWPESDRMACPAAGLPPDPADGFDWQARIGIDDGLDDLWRWAGTVPGKAWLEAGQ